MPFLYYLVFLVMLVTGFIANAFLRGGDAQSVAAVGRATTDTTPLEKLQREISIRRGVMPPQQEEHVEVKITPIAPIAVQTETAAVTSEIPVVREIKVEEVRADSAQSAAVQPKQAVQAKRTRHKEAFKCGPGGCGAKQQRSVWSVADDAP